MISSTLSNTVCSSSKWLQQKQQVIAWLQKKGSTIVPRFPNIFLGYEKIILTKRNEKRTTDKDLGQVFRNVCFIRTMKAMSQLKKDPAFLKFALVL